MRVDISSRHSITIESVSAWILRSGVVLSVAIMLAGMVVSLFHNGVDLERIQRSAFDYQPSLIWAGLVQRRGKAIVEVGIYLLVFTPILRVFASIVLFVFKERDWFYAGITCVVLVLTLAGLFLSR